MIFKLLIEELEQFQNHLNVNYENFRQYVERFFEPKDEEQQGLTAQRIQQFEQFQADESFVGDQCVICMGDIEIGRNMMRLDCDGQHIFVKSALKDGLLPRKLVQFVDTSFSDIFTKKHVKFTNYNF